MRTYLYANENVKVYSEYMILKSKKSNASGSCVLRATGTCGYHKPFSFEDELEPNLRTTIQSLYEDEGLTVNTVFISHNPEVEDESGAVLLSVEISLTLDDKITKDGLDIDELMNKLKQVDIAAVNIDEVELTALHFVNI